LQTGLIDPGFTYYDSGIFNIPGCVTGASGCVTLQDNDGEVPDSYINVTQALTVSSDDFFYNLGTMFWDDYKNNGAYGQQPIENTAAAYSYGQKTGIDLPGEDAGDYARVDSPTVVAKEHAQYPNIYKYGTWGTGNNIELAFGQGGTAITPIEQAVAYATFADNGTRYVPQIAAAIVSSTGKVIKRFTPVVAGHVPLTPADHAAMEAGFEGAVQSTAPGDLGTAASTFADFPFNQLSLAGKTGTASSTEQVPTSWFVGWGPVNDPRYLIAVVIAKGGYGASAAAPVAETGFKYLVSHPEGPVDLTAPTLTGSSSSPTRSATPRSRRGSGAGREASGSLRDP
jgi:penicillin-binding protein 2